MSAVNDRVQIADVIPADEHAQFVHRAVETFGVTRRSAERWIQHGVRWDRADQIAVKILGEHPEFLWGQKWADLADAATERKGGRR